jgi:hypothetical protein
MTPENGWSTLLEAARAELYEKTILVKSVRENNENLLFINRKTVDSDRCI